MLLLSRNCMQVLQLNWIKEKKTFSRLNNAQIRVELFDDVWSVLNRPFRYIALPLSEAKLKEIVFLD